MSEAPRPRIDPERASYHDSYKPTAIFLEGVAKHHDLQLVLHLYQAMQEGTFSMELLEQVTGKPMDELWTEFVVTLP